MLTWALSMPEVKYGLKAWFRHQKTWYGIDFPGAHDPVASYFEVSGRLPEPATVHLWDFEGRYHLWSPVNLVTGCWTPLPAPPAPLKLKPWRQSQWEYQWEWLNRFYHQDPFVQKVIVWRLWRGSPLHPTEHLASWMHLWQHFDKDWGWPVWVQWGPRQGCYGFTPEILWDTDSQGRLQVYAIGGTRLRLESQFQSTNPILRREHEWICEDVMQKLSELALPQGVWHRKEAFQVISGHGVEHWLSCWVWQPGASDGIVKPAASWIYKLHPTAALGYASLRGFSRDFLFQLPNPGVPFWRGVLWIDHPQVQVALILIRQIFWDAFSTLLPIGVGVTIHHDPQDQALEAYWKAKGLCAALGWECLDA